MAQFKNLKELLAKFSDETVCREYLIQRRWNGQPICPYCGYGKSYRIENGKRFKCANKECHKKYSVTVGTVAEDTNIPLSTWFAAIYLISAHKKGISSVQLGKDLGIQQKTAWFLLHRIREALREKNLFQFKGTVEIDETYLSRKFNSDFKELSPEEIERKRKYGKDKGLVVGMIERDTSRVRTQVFSEITAKKIKKLIEENIVKKSNVLTDDSMLYRNTLEGYYHFSVNHAQHEYVRGQVHTNHIENFWGIVKRGIYGIYHQVTFKHVSRYCDEFAYRFNSRKITDNVRFDLTLEKLEGRLTYNQLIQKDNGEKQKAKEGKSE